MSIFHEGYLNNDVIVLGAGHFWSTEAVFKILKGVLKVEPGYTDGKTKNPTYEEVNSGTTGHAEVVRITYDPKIISVDQILTVFFATHDPTTENEQGADVETQHRSIILYKTEEQKIKSKKFISNLNLTSDLGKSIATKVSPSKEFFPAENYHRNYYKNHPEEVYCKTVINPKLEKIKKEFPNLLKNHG